MIRLLSILVVVFLCSCSEESDPVLSLENELSGLRFVSDSSDNIYLQWDEPILSHSVENYFLWIAPDEHILDTLKQPNSELLAGNGGATLTKITPRDSTSAITKYLLDPVFIRSLLPDSNQKKANLYLWAKYKEGDAGEIQKKVFFLQDVYPASRVFPTFEPNSNGFSMHWKRPKDRTSVIASIQDSGAIFAYEFIVSHETNSVKDLDVINQIGLQKIIKNAILKEVNNASSSIYNKITESDTVAISLDSLSKRFVFLEPTTQKVGDALSVTFSGLKEQKEYQYQIFALDLYGNRTNLENNRAVPYTKGTIKTTDSKAPTKPTNLILDSVALGYGVLHWQAGDDDSSGIKEIRLIRTDSSHAVYSQDTIIDDLNSISQKRLKLSRIFSGVKYTFSLSVIDSSGFRGPEAIETFIIKDTLGVCPIGYVSIQSECVQKLEFNQADSFSRNIGAEEAQGLCQSQNDATWSYSLCTDTLWTSACSFSDTTQNYGIWQNSELTLSTACGIFTNDSNSSFSVNKRSLLCSNENGIYDMGGELQEWVLSTDSTVTQKHVLKGATYARPSTSSSDFLSIAQCGSTSYPGWRRPIVYPSGQTYYKLGNGKILTSVEYQKLDSTALFDAGGLRDSIDNVKANQNFYIYSVSLSSKIFSDTLNETLKATVSSLYPKEGTFELKTTFKGYSEANKIVPTEHFKQLNIGFRCCAHKN